MEWLNLFDCIVFKTASLSLTFAEHSFERCLLWLSLGNLCGCLQEPSQYLKTKTPNPAGHKLPVGLWSAWMPMVWLNTWPFITKFTRAGTSAGLDLPTKIWGLQICNKRWCLQRWKWFLHKCSSNFSTGVGDTFSWLKKMRSDLSSDAALSEVNNKTLYSCLEKIQF